MSALRNVKVGITDDRVFRQRALRFLDILRSGIMIAHIIR
jgi:hypothetical protein